MNAALAWLTWSLPFVLVTCGYVIVRKMTWRWHPALVAYLISESWLAVLTAAKMMPREWSILAQLIIHSALILEMLTFSRIGVTMKARASIAAGIVCTAAMMAGAHPWTLDRQLSLFRSHFRVGVAAVAIAITIYRLRFPALERHGECRRHKIYRVGMTAWLLVNAIAGAFVKGSLGSVVRYTPERWTAVGVVTYAALIGAVVTMAVTMAMSAPGRKRAAKKPNDGRTVTGLIEMERAA